MGSEEETQICVPAFIIKRSIHTYSSAAANEESFSQSYKRCLRLDAFQ